MKTLVSIDPGTSNSAAYAISYGSDLTDIETHKLESLGDFIDHMEELVDQSDSSDEVVAVCEQPPPFAGNPSVPSSAGFKLGQSFGEICGVIRALHIPLHLVSPRVWQKGFGGLKGLVGHKRKRVLADHAKRIFPRAKITVRNADAALIMHHFSNNTNQAT